MENQSDSKVNLRLSAILVGWVVAEVVLVVCGIGIGLAMRDTNFADNLLFFVGGPASASLGGYIPDTGLMIGDIVRTMDKAANTLYFLGGPLSALLGGYVAGEMGKDKRSLHGLLTGLLMVMMSIVAPLAMGVDMAQLVAGKMLLWWLVLFLFACVGALATARHRTESGGMFDLSYFDPLLAAEVFLIALFVRVFSLQMLFFVTYYHMSYETLGKLDRFHLLGFSLICLAIIPGAYFRRSISKAKMRLLIISVVLVVGGCLGLFISSGLWFSIILEAAILVGLLLLVLSTSHPAASLVKKATGSALLGLGLAALAGYGLTTAMEMNMRTPMLFTAGIVMLIFVPLILSSRKVAAFDETKTSIPYVHLGMLLASIGFARWGLGALLRLIQ